MHKKGSILLTVKLEGLNIKEGRISIDTFTLLISKIQSCVEHYGLVLYGKTGHTIRRHPDIIKRECSLEIVSLLSGSIDVRIALIEHFRDSATLMIATEAAAEGVNLQFCSLVVNYDLPWNPQRIEQRIGRCHRYGQKHDVVVINFLNERNEADRRVLELLTEKFNLFSGIFGASDEVLGIIESGVDFEKRILAIYQECRTPEEIDTAFQALQAELDEQIRSRLDDTRRALFEHFDEDVHQRLRLRLADAQAQLDRVGKRFWALTRYVLADHARFNNAALAFDLQRPPLEHIPVARYHLISKTSNHSGGGGADEPSRFLYRLSHPLGEYVIRKAKNLETPITEITFDRTHHPTKISMVEALQGKKGYLILTQLIIDSYEREEYLLFSGFTDDGKTLDQETMEKLFLCAGQEDGNASFPEADASRVFAEAKRHSEATISRLLEQNSKHFSEAREKLEKWADDMVLSAEKALADINEQIKALRRQSRQALTLEEQHQIQEKIQKLERDKRRKRQEIFKVEDEIMEKRDRLIDQLEKRLSQKTTAETLFTIKWKVA